MCKTDLARSHPKYSKRHTAQYITIIKKKALLVIPRQHAKETGTTVQASQLMHILGRNLSEELYTTKKLISG
jgi:hypothetical protein